ncbi:ABA responsive element binding factor [Vigna unguiculata]|uniref:ABA responsive element binding factor n=1 Tax=Vigna unguiculata TaxID=3917 RepID=A0A4D6M2M8_VIGUN|nr:ABA responsive element binding factor [Vigna unguiculata]
MGPQGGGDNNEKQLLHHPLVQQNSLYGLTLNEVQNQLGNTGKPLSSMNLDELLKNITKASLSLTSSLCKKTVDEVWRDVQESKDNKEKKFQERQLTLGDIKLEDFLVKAGVVVEPSSTAIVVNPNVATPQFPQHSTLMKYPQAQYQLPQQEYMVDKTFERRQKRMIKNRESAARSRARKQAYTIELEHKVSRLEEENEKLRRQKVWFKL